MWKVGILVKTNNNFFFRNITQLSFHKHTGFYLKIFYEFILYNITCIMLKELVVFNRKDTDMKIIELGSKK